MKSLRAGPAVAMAGVTLIPIEWIEINAQRDGGHVWWQVAKEPVAMVICEAGRVRLLDANGESLSLEDWLPRVDGLEASLAACSREGR